jgi:hypothetical protein
MTKKSKKFSNSLAYLLSHFVLNAAMYLENLKASDGIVSIQYVL